MMRLRTASLRFPLAILVAGLAAYANSVGGVFLFDDKVALLEIPRAHWSLGSLLGGTLRPLVKLSLAFNALLGGPERVWSYHVLNVTIHMCAALALFGLIHRAFRTSRLAAAYRQETASWLALSIAVLWVVHPLHTQSVTYIIQRGESLMGLWYLLVLYSLVRSTQSAQPRRWRIFCVICCALGMLSKPVMVSAPIVALLYDRIFLASGWRQLFRQRGWLYAALAATWLLFPLLMRNVPPMSEWTSGFGTPLVPSSWEYARTQPGVILHYLRLCVWPHPLVFDYAWPLAKTAREIWVPAAVIGGLLLATLWLLKRRPALGFLGAAFFLILAPTSSVYPIADPAFEYRMYLPLAAVLTLVVIGTHRLFQRLPVPGTMRRLIAGLSTVAIASLFITLTLQRNAVYASEERLWRDTIAKRPANARAHHNLGRTLAAQGQFDEAVRSYQEAVRLSPGFAIAYNNLGVALRKQGKLEEALRRYRQALALAPESAQVHNNTGVVLRQLGNHAQAMTHYTKALELDPNYAKAHENLGVLLASQGRFDEAIAQLEEALRLDPQDQETRANLTTARQQQQTLSQKLE